MEPERSFSSRVRIEAPPTSRRAYLETKARRSGHLLPITDETDETDERGSA